MDEVTIRTARIPADLAQLDRLYAEEARWHAEQWPDDFRLAAPEAGSDRDPDTGPNGRTSLEEQLTQSARDESWCLLVAEIRGPEPRLVGLVSGQVRPRPEGGLTRYDGAVAYVADLVVTRDFRRRGIGALLMEEMERWSRARGAATLLLNVHDRNEAATALYARQGFRRSNVSMRKELRS